MSGSFSSFDNASFFESDDVGGLIQNELGSSSIIDKSTEQAKDFESNVVSGNRTNLLFVESCHALIKDNNRIIKSNNASTDSTLKTILEYQNAVVGIQSGNFSAIDSLVNKYSPTEKAYKNKLWAIFRSAAAQLRINAHLDEIIKTEHSSINDS